MKTVDREARLKKLIFEVYDRGNVTTEEAKEILEMELSEFVTEFDAWKGED